MKGGGIVCNYAGTISVNCVHPEKTTSHGDATHELESHLSNLNLFVDLYSLVVWLSIT